MIAFINYKNGFTKEGVATREIIVEDGTETTKSLDVVEGTEIRLMVYDGEE